MIDKIGGAGFNHTDNIKGYSVKNESIPVSKGDSFEPSISGDSLPPSMSSITSAILGAKGLSKGDNNYYMRDQVLSTDGTLYAAYQDSDKAGSGYICAVNADNSVKWEVSGGPGRIHDIQAGPEGALFVKSDKYLKGFNADGVEIFNIDFQDTIGGYWADDKGNNYLMGAQGLHIIDKTGNEVKVSDEIRSLNGYSFKEGANDTMWCRDGDKLTPFNPSTGERGKSIEFAYNSSGNVYHADEFYPASDGGMIVRGKHAEVKYHNYREYDDIHHGLGFGRPFGRPFGGGLPPMDTFENNSTTINKYKYVSLDAEGRVTAESRLIEYGSLEAFSQKNQEIIIASSSPESDGKSPVTAMGNGSSERDLIKVEGYVRQIHTRESDGRIFIIHADKLTSVNEKGEDIKEFPMDKTKGMKILHSDSGPGESLVMKDSDSKKLYRWDLKTDSLTPLTDHSKDYSYKAAKNRVEKETAETQPKSGEQEDPKVVVEENYVIIDGIKLEINN